MAKFRLGKVWDFNLEITNSLLDDSFDGWEAAKVQTTAGMAMSTYWQVSATVSKIITAHGNSPYARHDMSKYDEANAEINRLREANKAAALLSQRLRQKWWKAIISVRLSRLTMLPPQSTTTGSKRLHSSRNIKEASRWRPLVSLPTKEVRDTELFIYRHNPSARASQHIRHSGRTYFYREKPCCHCIARSTKELRHSGANQ